MYKPDCIETRSTSTLFEEAYWLDAVAPGQWSSAEIKEAGQIVGRLPYIFKQRYGLSAVSKPRYTPWLGPWIRSSGAKLANELGHQHTVLEKLLNELPKAQRLLISCAPEFQNLQAFHWAGFDLRFSYTYRLTELSDEKRLWSNLRENIRRNCRKAEKVTVINLERGIADVIATVEKTFQRQGIDNSAAYPVLERIDEVMKRRGQREIYAAEGADGRVHAVVYIVYDDRHTFYLTGGGDPALRESGAHALAMWHAIKDTATRSQVFDFEGSIVRPIETFFRGFGPHQVPRYTAYRSSALVNFLEAFGVSSIRGRF